MKLCLRLGLFLILALCQLAHATRIKDITRIAGVRDNQLVGYGLVVGLDGTGDQFAQAPFTNQSFTNMLLRFGLHLPAGVASQSRNIAAVAISANLPPFAHQGQRIDITVSSLGNASSLRGGSLLMTPLKGSDGKTYAIAQGNVVVSGFGAQGGDGSRISVNVSSSGSIPNGATVENTIETPFVQNGVITFELNEPDFTTAARMENIINQKIGKHIAHAENASTISIALNHMAYKADDLDSPIDPSRYIGLISNIQNLDLEPASTSAKIIVNSKTGTIVLGKDVSIAPVAVAHGNLSVVISETPFVSQPNALGQGNTVQGTSSNISVQQQPSRVFVLAPGKSLKDLVEAINRVGAAPGDLIAILEAIKSAGALNGDLEVI